MKNQSLNNVNLLGYFRCDCRELLAALLLSLILFCTVGCCMEKRSGMTIAWDNYDGLTPPTAARFYLDGVDMGTGVAAMDRIAATIRESSPAWITFHYTFPTECLADGGPHYALPFTWEECKTQLGEALEQSKGELRDVPLVTPVP